MILRYPKLTPLDRLAVLVAAFSAATLLLELTWPHDLDALPPTEEVAAAREPAMHASVSIGALSEYLSISERPLFMHDRRPFLPVAEVAPVVAAAPRVEFELTAVIMTSDTRIALLRSNLSSMVQRVAVGETIDGWTLAEVTPESVLLRRETEVVAVRLRPDLDSARVGHAMRIEPLGSTN